MLALTMLRRTLALSLPALLGCSSAEPAQPSSDAGASQPASTPSADHEVELAPKPEPTPTPEPAKTVEPTAEPSATLEPLVGPRLVALREGSLALHDGWLLLDGEPVEIDAEGRLVRDPAFARGLEPLLRDSSDATTLAFVGDPRGSAFVTTALDHDRAATEYQVQAHEGDAWKPITPSKALTVEFYPAYLRRGEAILGLRAYAPNPSSEIANDEDSGSNPALLAALAKAKPGFVQLAGPSQPLPSLPEGVDLANAATSSDGTLYAITRRPPPRSVDDEDDPEWAPQLLVWKPDASQPIALGLPEAEGEKFTLSSAGDRVLIGGSTAADKPYLLVARGETIEQVSEGFAGKLTNSGWVRSATRSPTGELWMSVGEWPEADRDLPQSLWHRSPDSTEWTRVALALPSAEQVEAGKPRWVFFHYERRWYELARLAVPDEVSGQPAEAAATQVAWIGGALWIVADLGDALEGSEAIGSADVRRSGLYTTRVGPSPLVTLPSFDAQIVEQLANQPASKDKPGKGKCYRFSIVLAAAPREGDGLSPEQLAALEAGAMLDDEDDYASLELLYVGELAGQRELVISAAAGTPKLAEALHDLVATTLGTKPTLDCRPRAMVRAIRELGGA